MRTPAADALTELVLEVFRLNGVFLAAAEEIATPVGLTAARWQVLGALLDQPGSVAEIARRMGLARQSVQRLADVLADEGLVEYSSNPAHKRAKLVCINEKGRTAISSLGPCQHEWANRFSDGVSAIRMRQAVETLRALTTRMEVD